MEEIQGRSTPEQLPTPEQLLSRFGLSTFRPGQRQAVDAALEGKDVLLLMPTGGGKSLCYQLPSLVGEKLTLVVSPLIALMDDQRRRLREAGVDAAMLASTLDMGEHESELRKIASGQAKLALVAPERFASSAFRDALSQREVGLFVVDEAHCVSEWGHDFRPDYLRLRGVIDALGRPPVMASTATATPRVASEIAARLGLTDWVFVSSGFDRPNLSFDVLTFEGKGAVASKRGVMEGVLRGEDSLPAIVYCGTRKDVEQVASGLSDGGIAALPYHAGMRPEQRSKAQEAFMSGETEVIVATNAFGMGIDKADVRTVIHWALPTSLEAYYQEAGRAGRDGKPARALLLSARMDLGRLIRFNNERNVSVKAVHDYVAWLRRGANGASVVQRRPSDEERILLSIAERSGAVTLEPGEKGTLRMTLTGAFDERQAYSAMKVSKDRGWEAYRAIERYSASEVCRRLEILKHFGDEGEGHPSGRCCDVCDPDEELKAIVEIASRAALRRGGGRSVKAGGGARATSGPSGVAAPDPLSSEEQTAFERLKAWRLGQAEGKPAYTVAHNSTLIVLLRKRPSSLDELQQIKGIGPSFCAKHGESLLAELSAL